MTDTHEVQPPNTVITTSAVSAAPSNSTSSAAPPVPPPVVVHSIPTHPKPSAGKRLITAGIVILVLAAVAYEAAPWVREVMSTVSTDDAYVNGHATFVAARVPGQVTKVLVDDNNRVRKGDLIVQLDKEPYQVQVNIAKSLVDAAKADLTAANAQARAIEGEMRSYRFALQRAIEDVDNQVALLHSRVATLHSTEATLTRAQSDYDRAAVLQKSGSVSTDEIVHRQQSLAEAKADNEVALQGIYQVRVALGLPAKPTGDDLTEVPSDLDETFSSIKAAQARLIQSAAQIGAFIPLDVTPKQMIADFYKRDPSGDLNKIYDSLLKDAPIVKQAEAKLEQSQRNLDQAELNLRYCDVYAEIDGVVARRDVNPGNNILAGQQLMAIRSITDIWVDCNFKETQIGAIRIGQPVDLEVDMYGRKKIFKGRVTGFSMGTGSTLALLPAENATGNFVKVVQRLPVRVDLVDYDPETQPLFIGLSVSPHVRINEEPAGADAGKVLQPLLGPATQAAAISADTQPALAPMPTATPATLPGALR